MPDFHAAILDSNLRSLERTAQASLSGPAKAHAVAKLRRMTLDASTLNRSGGDAAVLGDVIGRATALADRLEGKRPAAAPQLTPVTKPAAPVPAPADAVAVVRSAAPPPAASPPPPPQADHRAGWKRAVAAAGGQSLPDPATSPTAAGWRKAIDAATGRNL